MSDRSRAWTLIVLGAGMAFGAPPAMLLDGSYKRGLLAELRRDGRRVVASVEWTSPSYARDRRVSYSFEANEKSYQKTEDVSSDVMDRAQRQGDVEVLYSARRPDHATADSERIARSADALLSWGPCFAIVFGLSIGALGLDRLRRSS